MHLKNVLNVNKYLFECYYFNIYYMYINKFSVQKLISFT